MSEIDIKKRADELEQTLKLQLAQLKKDSQVWFKVGGAALAIGLIVTVVAKSGKSKRNRKNRKLKDVFPEPVQKFKGRKAKTASFFAPVRKRIFLALFSLGQAKLMKELKKRNGVFDEA